MFELVMLVIAMLALARHPRKVSRRRIPRGKYIRGRINFALDLGTLAPQTLISADNAQTVDEKTLVSSIRATYSLGDVTLAAGVGPIIVGVAHSDYTDAEMEAVLENTGAWRPSDKVAEEISKRLVRIIGSFSTEGSVAGSNVTLNDGKPIKTKLNWMLRSNQTLAFFAFNDGDVAFSSTDPDMKIQGVANLWEK